MTYSKIYDNCVQKNFFKNHDKVLIAVSGGVDSMNLLHFLHLYKEQLEIEIAIAHINHKQRQESDLEESYLKSWAQENKIPIYISHFTGAFSEEKARAFRYDFFKKVMREDGYTALVTAHHADDQIETIMMRLVRGSLLRYLSGIKEVQTIAEGQVIRPFLTVKKEDLPAIFHFEDASNAGQAFFRNRIRNHYIPLLESENPRFSESLLSLSQESTLLLEALSDLTTSLDIQERSVFSAQTDAVQYFLLQDYLTAFPNLQLSRKQFQELLHILSHKKEGHFPLKQGYELILTDSRFFIEKISPETESNFQELLLEYDSSISFPPFKFTFSDEKADRSGECIIPLFSLAPITLRKRQPGDKIDFGSFSKKLRRLFIDEKFSIKEREEAIVGVQEKQVIFVLVAGQTYLRKALNSDIIKAKLYIEK